MTEKMLFEILRRVVSQKIAQLRRPDFQAIKTCGLCRFNIGQQVSAHCSRAIEREFHHHLKHLRF